MGKISIETVFYLLEALAALALVGIGGYLWRQSRKTRHQRHAKKVLNSLGLEYRQNIVLPDGLDGLVFIDYLLLVPDGVVVLDIYDSEGHLFGGDSVDQWTQVVNNKTYKFPNPLYTNQAKCQAVHWNVEQFDAEIAKNWHSHGWISFTNAGNFPKGIPAQVSMIDELKTNLAPLSVIPVTDGIHTTAHSIWAQLYDLSINTRIEYTQQATVTP